MVIPKTNKAKRVPALKPNKFSSLCKFLSADYPGEVVSNGVRFTKFLRLFKLCRELSKSGSDNDRSNLGNIGNLVAGAGLEPATFGL